jgi:pyridoxine 5'-phosphate synthase PdxJ
VKSNKPAEQGETRSADINFIGGEHMNKVHLVIQIPETLKVDLKKIVAKRKRTEDIDLSKLASIDINKGGIPFNMVPELVELNIGHFIIGEAIFIGLEDAIGRMRRLMDEARA